MFKYLFESIFHFFSWISIHLSRHSNSYDNSVFNFWGTFNLFSTTTALFYLPTVYECFNFHPALIFHIFNYCQHTQQEVVSHCGFELHLSKWLMMLSIFSCAAGIFYIFREMYIQISSPTFFLLNQCELKLFMMLFLVYNVPTPILFPFASVPNFPSLPSPTSLYQHS